MNQELDADWSRTLRIWWAFTWRTLFGSAITLLMLLVIVSALERAGTLHFNLTGSAAQKYRTIATWILSGFVAIFHASQLVVIYFLLDARFGNFRLKAFSTQGDDQKRLRRSIFLAMRLWWALLWRTYLSLSISLAAMLVLGGFSLDHMLLLNPILTIGVMQHLLSNGFDGVRLRLTPLERSS